jgi:hypothetical protein
MGDCKYEFYENWWNIEVFNTTKIDENVPDYWYSCSELCHKKRYCFIPTFVCKIIPKINLPTRNVIEPVCARNGSSNNASS